MRWLLTWGYFKSIPENVDNPKINLPCGAMWGWSIPVIYGDFGDGLLGLPHDPALKLMQWFCHTFSTQCQTPWVNSIQIPPALPWRQNGAAPGRSTYPGKVSRWHILCRWFSNFETSNSSIILTSNTMLPPDQQKNQRISSIIQPAHHEHIDVSCRM